MMQGRTVEYFTNWSKHKLSMVSALIRELQGSRPKDADILLEKVSEDTGYNKDFLVDCITELVEDGESWDDAVEDTVIIAYEYDF